MSFFLIFGGGVRSTDHQTRACSLLLDYLMQQAWGRAHRHGQTKEVSVHLIIKASGVCWGWRGKH